MHACPYVPVRALLHACVLASPLSQRVMKAEDIEGTKHRAGMDACSAEASALLAGQVRTRS